MTDPRTTPIIGALPASVPFVGPEAQERQRGRPFAARLGANENAFGPSPRAIAAMERAAGQAWMYGDPESYDLKQALAQHHGIAAENIVVGEGIDGLLGYLCRLMIAPGDGVVTSDGAYPTFNFHVAAQGGALHKVPYRDDHEDPQALLAMARETGARLIYFANPDNPMGSWHDGATVQRMIDALPDGTLLVLDEAYVDCAPVGTAPPLTPDDPRVIRMRTFSKAYALAGARVGYAIAHPALIRAFDKVRNHFGMSRLAQAGALAALADQTHLSETLALIARARDRIGAIGRANGLMPLPSATNFVALDTGQGGTFARRLVTELIARDIFVRMPFAAPQDRCIRISCGTDDDLAALAAALHEALQAAGT